MKKTFLAVVALITSLAFSHNTQAQASLKIGYTNVEYIFVNLPEAKQIESELKTKEQQYQNLIQQRYKEYQDKLADYEKNGKTWADLIRQEKEKELMEIQTKIQEFQTTSREDLQKKQEVLMQPVLAKIQGAIDVVAKENAYTHVFNNGLGGAAAILLFATPESDITELVFKKMGVTPPVKNVSPATPAATPKK